MMGLGYLGSGGSSSSSNLSPLAPPFTVDRSNPKPNSNPLVHFTEPPYAAPFSSSLHSWQYSPSSASRPDFFPNRDSEVDSIRTTSLPSANDYPYVGSESIISPSTHWPPLDPIAKTMTDSFSYLGEPKPYYPPYVSPAVNGDTPLVALNEPSFDLLSTSGLVPMEGSSQVDYTKSLSGLEYTPQWGGFWNGLAEGKRGGKRMEVNGSFCSEEMNLAGLVVYNNYMKQGAGTAENLSKCKEDSIISHGKYVDVSGRENLAGFSSKGQLADKSFLAHNHRFISVESAETPIVGTGTVLPESHTQTPSLESAMNSWNRQKSYSPYEKRFQLFDSRTNECNSVTKSSSIPVVRPPDIGTTFPAPKLVSSKTMDIGNVAAVNRMDVGNHIPSEENLPYLLLSSEGKEGCLDTNELRFLRERNEHRIFVASSSTTEGKEGCLDTNELRFLRERNEHPIFVASSSTKEELSNKLLSKNAFDNTFNERSGFQVPDINVPDGFYLVADTNEAFKSTANSSESLDSPCWKGAPAAQFSPFGVFEAATPQHLMNKLEASKGLNLEGTHIFPSYNDSVKSSYRHLDENSIENEEVCVDNGLSLTPKRTSDANFTAKEQKSGDAMKAGSCSAKLSSSKEVQSFNDANEPRKPKESKSDSDSKPYHTKQPSLEEDCFTSNRSVKSGAGVVDAGKNTSDVSEDSCFPFHAVESVLCLPSSGEEAAKLVKPRAQMNVHMLVNAMHNLSELLLFHWSKDACALNEEDHEALKNVIGNLDACMSKKLLQMTQTQESMFPQQGTSHKLGWIPDLYMLASGAEPQVTDEVAANFHGRLDCRQSMPEQKRNYEVSDMKLEKNLDFVSTDNAEVLKDHNMVQAIKKVLDKNLNFPCEEELQSQTLLYKNLWLEAEAELCTTSYRARFDRMKIEMQKCKLDKAKDVSEDTTAVEKLPSSKVSPDQNISHTVTHAVTDCPMPNNSVQDSPILSSTSHVGDVEASVMARFHILKFQGENSNPINVEVQQVPEFVDAVSSGKRKCWPIIGDQSENKSFDVAVGPRLQHHTGNGNEDKFGSYLDDPEHETVKEFRVCVTDDPAIQFCRKNRLQNQLPSGWHDSSSSDWEHVLKDEFAWQN